MSPMEGDSTRFTFLTVLDAVASARRWIWAATVVAGTSVSWAVAQPTPRIGCFTRMTSSHAPRRQASTNGQVVERGATRGHKFRSAFETAVAQCEQAIASGRAGVSEYVALAEASIGLWCFGFVPRDAILARAETAVDAALRLDDKNARAHMARGVLLLARRDWHAAEQRLQRAVRLGPDQARVRQWYALFLSAMGRHEAALAESRRAVMLDASPGTQTVRGATYYFARKFETMVRHMERTVQASPSFAPAYDWLGMAYVETQAFGRAIETYARAVELSDGMAEIKAGLGHAYGMAGKDTEARQILDELTHRARREYVPSVQVAFVHISLEQNDAALGLLEKAYSEGAWELVFMQVEPWLDPLRAEPRFRKLEQRMRFPK